MLLLSMYHLFITVFALSIIVIRLKKYGNIAVVDYNLFLLFLAVFYLSISFNFKYLLGIALIPYNDDTFFISGLISAWFVTVYLLIYTFIPNKYNIIVYHPIRFFGLIFFKILLTIIFIFGLFVLIKNFGPLTSFTNRTDKFDYFMQNIFMPYKITIFFNIGLIYSFFLAYVTKRWIWLLSILPYIALEIIVGNRNFMFQSILAFFVLVALQNRGKFPFGYSILGFSFLALFSIFRESFTMTGFLQGLGYALAEFTNTRETQEIALQSGISYDLTEYLMYSYMRIFPGSVYDNIFGNFGGAMGLIESLKDTGSINFGMGSSIVTDAIFLFNDNLALIFIYPILHGLFGVFINYLQRNGGLTGLLVFMYSIGFLFLTMRYGFFTTALIPFYVVFLYASPIVLAEIFAKNKKSIQITRS